MKAKLIIEGREFPIEIQDPELQKLLMPRKKTGYERVGPNESFYIEDELGVCKMLANTEESVKDEIFENATYYSSETVAENNSRADRLMRQLRRFAVEHREKEINWDSMDHLKWSISYDHYGKKLSSYNVRLAQEAFSIYFESKEKTELAIETFHDELIWYFTKYKDSL